MLWPFFTYYGGKWRDAPNYPKPQHETIIEPFAGSAGYALRYPAMCVKLFDADPIICAVWTYLITADPQEVLGLPDVDERGVDALEWPCDGAKWLAGFWLNKGTASPCKRPSAWMRSGIRPNSMWGPVIRSRIAEQLPQIRHWSIERRSYERIPNQSATWFVDPPYQMAGKHYRHGSRQIDYRALADFCRTRHGQVIVCENEGADWLPFSSPRHIKTTVAGRGLPSAKEVVCLMDNACVTETAE